MKKYQFKLKWGFLIFCLVFFVICVSMGVWQLHRYSAKKNLLAQLTHLKVSTNIHDVKPFQKIKIVGTYQNDLNILHHSFRDEVLTPLKIKGEKKLLLVDRGWVETLRDGAPFETRLSVHPEERAQHASRRAQGERQLKKVSGIQQITGDIKFLGGFQMVYGENLISRDPIIIIQKIDINDLSRITGQEFFPFIVRLDPKAPHGFKRDWPVPSATQVTPERHLGYAVQWFSFALILWVGYFFFCLEKKEE
jgi:surfeit locus 1 family protein